MIIFGRVFLIAKEVNERGSIIRRFGTSRNTNQETLIRRPRDAWNYCILEEDANFSANLPLTFIVNKGKSFEFHFEVSFSCVRIY